MSQEDRLGVIERWECGGCRKPVGLVHGNGCIATGRINRDDETTGLFKYVPAEQLRGAVKERDELRDLLRRTSGGKVPVLEEIAALHEARTLIASWGQ